MGGRRWRPIGRELLSRFAEERERRGKPALKPLKNRVAREYRDLTVKTGQHYTDMIQLARKDPKRFLRGGYPLRAINLRFEYVELEDKW